MPLSSAVSSATCSNEPVQRHRLRHAFQFMAAAFLGDEETRHLTLHPRRDHDCTRLGQRLGSCRDVRHVAEYLARSVDHHWPQVDGDACGEGRLACTGVLTIQFD